MGRVRFATERALAPRECPLFASVRGVPSDRLALGLAGSHRVGYSVDEWGTSSTITAARLNASELHAIPQFDRCRPLWFNAAAGRSRRRATAARGDVPKPWRQADDPVPRPTSTRSRAADTPPARPHTADTPSARPRAADASPARPHTADTTSARSPGQPHINPLSYQYVSAVTNTLAR